MTQEAVGDGARRRLRLWPPRGAADDVAVPHPDALSGVEQLTALLEEIDAVRLGLVADLGLVASALDAEVPEIARDVLAGAQHDLARFALRAELTLRDAADAEPPAVALAPSALRPRRGRRLALLAPALTAAAALVGLLAGVVPSTGPAVPERSIATSAAASYAELYRLHELGASAPRLARAARQLHAEVARLVAVAGDDPAATRQALRLLELQVRVLQDHGGSLAAELAESRRLLETLRSAALRTTAVSLLADLPAPTTPDDLRLPTTAAAAVPAPDQQTIPAAPAPAPAPQRAPSATEPAPAAAPAEEPSPPDSDEPSPKPTTSPAPDDPSTWFPTDGTGSVLPG